VLPKTHDLRRVEYCVISLKYQNFSFKRSQGNPMELNRHQASTNVAAYFMGGALAAIGSIALVSPPGFAQLTPDDTLGTTVVENAAVDGIPAILIRGGTQANSNLFHSFQEFNVNTGQRVYFANPIEIQNILTRVTGGNVSNIDGIVGVDGAANLY
jgi:large exoprotein involved in heme utilization and adhesion